MRVIIIGGGDQAQVVADILLGMRGAGSAIEPIGYLDDNPALRHKTILGLPVLGAIAELSQFAHDTVILAIGDNAVRRRLYCEMQEMGERFITASHPSAIISPSALIGNGTVICASAVVGVGARIGVNVILNTAATVDHHNIVGDHAHVSAGVHLGGNVKIGEGVLVGMGAIVMSGRGVGDWSLIGVGALVHRDVPNGVTAVGVPARVLKAADPGQHL